MKASTPAIQLPSISPTDATLKSILRNEGFATDENILQEVRRFVHAVDFTAQVFKYNHHEINEPIIKEYNKKVRDLRKYAAEDLRNITAITVTVKSGRAVRALTFYNDALSGHLVKKLFGEPKPDMTINGSFKDQVRYSHSTKLIMPLKEFTTQDKDQLFISIVKDAVPLGKFTFKQYTGRKAQIQRLVMALLSEYFPFIDVSPATEKKTFQNYFNKKLG